MSRIPLLLAAALVSIQTAGAEDITACLAIGSDLDRLACYDRVSGRTPEVATTAAETSAWIVDTATSAMTDDIDVTLSVNSEEIVDCGWNKGDRILLVIRCKENTTALFFVTQCHMTSSTYNDYGDVQWRIDDRKAETVPMQNSTDNRALGLWAGGRSIPAIKRLLDGKKLITRMTPFGENPFTATFPIVGLDSAIEPLRKACGW